MKKIVLIIICIILISTPIISAYRIEDHKDNDNLLSKADSAPYWAEGSFIGKWGIREYSIFFNGLINIELGNISGYYATGFLNRLEGKIIPKWNETLETNIIGRSFGPFIFGFIGDLEMEDVDYSDDINETIFVGLGNFNETEFNYRLMGQNGPTFYIKAEFSKIN